MRDYESGTVTLHLSSRHHAAPSSLTLFIIRMVLNLTDTELRALLQVTSSASHHNGEDLRSAVVKLQTELVRRAETQQHSAAFLARLTPESVRHIVN